MNRDAERETFLRMAERVPQSYAARVVAAGPAAVERYLDYIAAQDARTLLGSFVGAGVVDLRRWRQHPEVKGAVREARAAARRATELMLEVSWAEADPPEREP